jgi:hypothetical protein
MGTRELINLYFDAANDFGLNYRKKRLGSSLRDYRHPPIAKTWHLLTQIDAVQSCASLVRTSQWEVLGVLHRWGKATRRLNEPVRVESEAGQSVGGVGEDNEQRVEGSAREVESERRRMRAREASADGRIGGTQQDNSIRGYRASSYTR